MALIIELMDEQVQLKVIRSGIEYEELWLVIEWVPRHRRKMDLTRLRLEFQTILENFVNPLWLVSRNYNITSQDRLLVYSPIGDHLLGGFLINQKNKETIFVLDHGYPKLTNNVLHIQRTTIRLQEMNQNDQLVFTLVLEILLLKTHLLIPLIDTLDFLSNQSTSILHLIHILITCLG